MLRKQLLVVVWVDRSNAQESQTVQVGTGGKDFEGMGEFVEMHRWRWRGKFVNNAGGWPNGKNIFEFERNRSRTGPRSGNPTPHIPYPTIRVHMPRSATMVDGDAQVQIPTASSWGPLNKGTMASCHMPCEFLRCSTSWVLSLKVCRHSRPG